MTDTVKAVEPPLQITVLLSRRRDIS